jgi:hypothetical protein
MSKDSKRLFWNSLIFSDSGSRAEMPVINKSSSIVSDENIPENVDRRIKVPALPLPLREVPSEDEGILLCGLLLSVSFNLPY